MQHLDEGQIHAWLDGALSADESAGVERHVAQCEACASLVAEARGMIAGATRIVSSLDIVRGGVIPKSTRAASAGSIWRSLHLTPARAALAATLLIAVSTLLTVRHDTPNKFVPAKSQITAGPVSPATDVVAAAPAALAPVPAPADTANSVSRSASTPTPSSRVSRQEQPKPASVEPPRRDLAAVRDQAADSARMQTSAKVSAAEESRRNTATAQSVVAAAPPSASPVAGGTLGAMRADAVRPFAKANKDSVRPGVRADSLQQTIVSGAVSGFAPRALDVAQRMREAAALATNPADAVVAGCYQLTPDSSANAGAVVERFALDPARGGSSARNVVRAVTPEGRIDGVVDGSYWVQRLPGLIELRSTSGDSVQSLQIRFPVGSDPIGVTNIGGSRTRPLFISRIVCRP